jgi:hypothetical protein
MEQFVLAREGCFAAALLLLVTDSNRALDMRPGNYRFGPEEDMDAIVRTMACQTSARLPNIIRVESLTPAERIGIADESAVSNRMNFPYLSRKTWRPEQAIYVADGRPIPALAAGRRQQALSERSLQNVFRDETK